MRYKDGIFLDLARYGTVIAPYFFKMRIVSITFDPRGLSNANTITVTNARGTKNVSVAPTGRVVIE
jgi:hypothetical protein